MRIGALLALAALASGCSIHLTHGPAAGPRSYEAAPSQAAPVAAPAPEAQPAPRRARASEAGPTAYARVTTPPANSKPEPGAQHEPRPTTLAPVKPRPGTVQQAAPVTHKPAARGRYPFRNTRPEPRRPVISDAAASNGGEKRVRVPVAALR